VGLTAIVIGRLYLFGARTGGRQFLAASVIDRLIFVPVVLLPLALTGVFPHLLVAFAILDMSLGVGAWLLFCRGAWLRRWQSSPRRMVPLNCRFGPQCLFNGSGS
jgi:hypothetical protein